MDRSQAGRAAGRRFAAAAVFFSCTLLVVAGRETLLTTLGGLLVAADPLVPADLVAATMESGVAGLLEAGDLYREGRSKLVALLNPAPTAVDEELDRRGVRFPDVAVDTLVQLGVPRDAVLKIEAGEGGTSGGACALARWVREHEPRRVVVVIGPSHGRRYRRALVRVWPADRPLPIVKGSRYHPFRPDNWWQSRTTLREGIYELQKLLLDFIVHPL